MKKIALKKSFTSVLVISSFLTTAFIAVPLFNANAQQVPSLPSLDNSASVPELPNVPELSSETPELPDLSAPSKKKDASSTPELIGVESANKGEVAPEADLPMIGVSKTRTVTDSSVAPSLPEIPVQQVAPAPIDATKAPVLEDQPSPYTQSSTLKNDSAPGEGVAVNTVVPQLSAGKTKEVETKEKEVNSVLNDVFGESKPDTKMHATETVKTIDIDKKAQAAAEPKQADEAEPIVDEKVITEEEVRALEASTQEYSFDSGTPKQFDFNKKYTFKSQTYSDAQIGNQLVRESMAGKTDNVNALINSGASVNAADENQQTALMGAVFTNNEPLIDLLLSKGANPNLKDKNGNNALHVAVVTKNPKLVQKMLSSNADVNAKNNSGDTPLLLSINSNQALISQQLLSNGADVSASNNEGLTPLHMAAYSGNADLIKNLLAKGASKTASSRQGLTAYDVANARHPQIAALLMVERPYSNPDASVAKTADYSNQLSMFPKELVEEPKQEVQQRSDWWGGAEEAQSARPVPAQMPSPEANPVVATLTPVDTDSGLTDIQNIPMSLRLSNPAYAKNAPVIPQAPVTKQVVSTEINSPKYDAKLNAKIDNAIKSNAVSNADLSNSPSTPVQGLTKVSYEAEKVVTQTNIQLPAGTPVAQLAPTAAVPASIRLSGGSVNPVVSQPSINQSAEPQMFRANRAPVTEVESETMEAPTASIESTTTLEPLKIETQKTVVANPTAPQPVLAAEDASAPKNLASGFEKSPIRNLNSVDYVGFYNGQTNKAAPVAAPTPASAPAQIAAAPSSTGSSLQSYSTLSASEKEKWDARMSEWLASKASGSSDAEMLNKQERILRVVYQDKFQSAVKRLQP